MVSPSRVFALNKKIALPGPVVYWMSRDQRVNDNWALLFAAEMAASAGQPLVVIFCMVPSYLNAQKSHYSFMISGLKKVSAKLNDLNIPFFLLKGEPRNAIPEFIEKHRAGILVTDFNPLRINRHWKNNVSDQINIPFFEVDAHNIVPCRTASLKQEFSARTIRPKILSSLNEYLTDFPPVPYNHYSFDGDLEISFPEFESDDQNFRSGEEKASEVLSDFIMNRLNNYAADKNHPDRNGLSGLSPYLHFGQISAQRVVLEINKTEGNSEGKRSFLEEIIVRKELADNFCFYNPDYDSFKGFHPWAKKTLDEHRKDEREVVYTLRQFEDAQTVDRLWNAAQAEMVATGKMHGYLRMYWAKKILEWSSSPEDAMETAVYLNDKYSLDGRDPNGYAGISWSVGGTHDRPWFERPVFGKIRYMSFNGMKSKFNVEDYIRQHKV